MTLKGQKQPSRLLKAMRKVASQPKEADQGELEGMARAVKEESATKFMDRLSKLESEHSEHNAKARQGRGAGGEDKGEKAATEVLERWLEGRRT